MIFEPFVYHWHYCLVQTGVIHISKIRGYKLLDSFDFISFEGCESHLSKYISIPITNKGERTHNLFELIYISDVYEALNIFVRYFVSLTSSNITN
jgi:hypothetical protein